MKAKRWNKNPIKIEEICSNFALCLLCWFMSPFLKVTWLESQFTINASIFWFWWKFLWLRYRNDFKSRKNNFIDTLKMSCHLMQSAQQVHFYHHHLFSIYLTSIYLFTHDCLFANYLFIYYWLNYYLFTHLFISFDLFQIAVSLFLLCDFK